MSATSRIPNFAGVALVDIFANSVAVLMIVTILSIAARLEREEQYSEQVDEIAAMMSRKFSTSLVLNQLAAHRPARLHDYRTSPIDKTLDPAVMPILELHRSHVREFYSGAVWTRRVLLQDPNPMDDWLSTFTPRQKRSIRLDLYDVGQYYLATSILSDHGVIPRHFHWLGGGLDPGQAVRCPPGVPSSECAATGLAAEPGRLPDLPQEAAASRRGAGSDWAPVGGFPGDGLGPLPGGAALGGGLGGGLGPEGSGEGAFPGAFAGLGEAQGEGQGRGAGGGRGGGNAARGEEGIRFRLALPETLNPDRRVSLGAGVTITLRGVLAGLMGFLGEVQDTLDTGRSPARQIAGFRASMARVLAAPPPLTEAQSAEVDSLSRRLFLSSGIRQGGAVHAPFPVRGASLPAGEDAALLLAVNRPLHEVAVGRAANDLGAADELPAEARPAFSFNSYPGIWRGLGIDLDPGAVILMPPEQKNPDELRWRVAAYIAPGLDDFIIGFVYAAVDSPGWLRLQVDANRVRLGGQHLATRHPEHPFGARGWLVALYAALALALGLCGFLFVRRLGRGRSGAGGAAGRIAAVTGQAAGQAAGQAG